MAQLVSGERPFAEMSYSQILFCVLCQRLRPEWPVGRCNALRPLYESCTAQDPTQRPTFEQVGGAQGRAARAVSSAAWEGWARPACRDASSRATRGGVR